jgi:MFS transporter, OFA family, oxalate/formate antiporter
MRRRFNHIPFSPARLPVFYGWPILAAGSLGLLMSVPGQTMGVSVFTDSLLDALGMTRSQLSMAYMFGTIGSACLLPWAGRLCDRLGTRAMAVVASLCLAGVLLILSQSDSLARAAANLLGLPAAVSAFVVMLVGFLALRFWGQGVLTLSSHNMIAKWFDRKRGLASGLTGLCVALGFSAAPLALDLLIRQFGWRGAWVAMAAIIGGLFALIAWVLYRDNPEDCGLRPDGAAEPVGQGDNEMPVREPCWTRPQAARTWAFWTFSFSLALFGMYMTGLTFHIVSVFSSAGMTRLQAVSIFLPASLVAVLVHLSAGWLSDRMALNRLLIVMLAAMGVATVGLAFLAPGLPVLMIIIGNGVGGGLFGLLSAVTWAKFFGRTHLGAISGLHMSVGVLFSAVGPVLFSQSLAWSGSYRLAAYVCLAAASIMLVAARRAKQPMPARTATMPVTPALEPVVAIEAAADEKARLPEEYAQV